MKIYSESQELHLYPGGGVGAGKQQGHDGEEEYAELALAFIPALLENRIPQGIKNPAAQVHIQRQFRNLPRGFAAIPIEVRSPSTSRTGELVPTTSYSFSSHSMRGSTKLRRLCETALM